MGRFPKRQRKLSVTDQAFLFKTGQVAFRHPYKLFHLLKPVPPDTAEHAECKIVISVPKRNFKKAVHRNRLKRQIREAFRAHSSGLNQILAERKLQMQVLCLYLPNEFTDFATLSSQMEALLERLTRLAAQHRDFSDAAAD